MELTTDKVREVTDRAHAALAEISEDLAWQYALDSGDGDAWGHAMSHAFALNDLAYCIGAECAPDYRPAPHLVPYGGSGVVATDEFPDADYVEMVSDGRVTVDQVSAAVKVYAVLVHALDMAGVSY